jgi:intracellular septation protein A
MLWMLVAAIAVSGTLATFTDWLFMGVLFHQHYNRYPEIWWPAFREKGDRRAIVYSSVLAYVTSAAIVALCWVAQSHGFAQALILSLLAWIAGPVVVLVTNGFWIKIDPHVTFAHTLGWLARFALAGAAAGFVLR